MGFTEPRASASGNENRESRCGFFRKCRRYFWSRPACASLAGFFLLTGCGYIGEPLPPAFKRPVRVVDLAAVERGSNIIIQFTIPKVTTEGLPIKAPEDIELRAGPADSPFKMEDWERTSDRVPVPSKDQTIARIEVPAKKWYGKTVDIAVNVHGPGGRSVGWSQFAIVTVVSALPTPADLKATDAPDAVHLEWLALAPEFRIFRKPVDDPNWMQVGTSTRPVYTDNMIEYGKTYQYEVQSIQKTDATYAESELSDVKTVKPEDHFAPAVPAGVSAVPGTRSIDLVWDRNTEKDFASYTVYRGGQKIAEGLTAPVYSDRDAKPGTRYSYQVGALDTTGNESAKSPAVEAAIP
jgi:hypothetical protein